MWRKGICSSATLRRDETARRPGRGYDGIDQIRAFCEVGSVPQRWHPRHSLRRARPPAVELFGGAYGILAPDVRPPLTFGSPSSAASLEVRMHVPVRWPLTALA